VLFDPEGKPYRYEGNIVTTIKRLIPLRIESYNPYPSFIEADPSIIQDFSLTQIVTQSGSKHVIDMDIEEFEHLMDNWDKQ
jgi:hypothetical protein